MKLYEFALVETSEDEIGLGKLAKAVKDYIEISSEMGNTNNSFTLGDVVPDSIFANSESLAPLADVKFRVFAESKPGEEDTGGIYYPKSNTIAIFGADPKNRYRMADVPTVILHELRHALDYAKGNRFKGKVKHADNEREEYTNLPHEINARFSEALGKTKDDFVDACNGWQEVLNFDKFKGFLDRRLTQFELGHLKQQDPKSYKRLLSRAADFYKHLAEKLKNEFE